MYIAVTEEGGSERVKKGERVRERGVWRVAEEGEGKNRSVRCILLLGSFDRMKLSSLGDWCSSGSFSLQLA